VERGRYFVAPKVAACCSVEAGRRHVGGQSLFDDRAGWIPAVEDEVVANRANPDKLPVMQAVEQVLRVGK